MNKIKEKIKQWWDGEEIYPPRDPYGPARPNRPSIFKRHWTSNTAHRLMSLYTSQEPKERLVVIGLIIAILSLLVSFLALIKN